MVNQRIKNLDTFRAIAAIVVMIGHIELFLQNTRGGCLFNIVPSGHSDLFVFYYWFYLALYAGHLPVLLQIHHHQ